MNRLRQLFAAALAAGLVALAPPSFAQDGDAGADPAAELVDGADADGAEAATDEGTTATDPDAAVDAADDPVEDVDAAIEDVELEETPSPWSNGLVMSITAMCIGGFSAVLGIWVDRDKTRPRVFAVSMSFLILCALVVGVAQSYLDEVERIEKDQDLERMLDMTYEIAVSSGNPELIKLVEESSGVSLDLPAADAPAPPDAPAPMDAAAPDGDGAPAQ